MTLVKAFGILVEAQGEGVEDRRNPTPAGQKRPDLGAPVIADIADIADIGKKALNSTPEFRGVVATSGAYLLSAVSSLSETAYFPPSSTVSAWP
jgi:hypothetical protein